MKLAFWMIGADQEQATADYILSASQVLSTEKFVKHIISLLTTNNNESFSGRIYKNVTTMATKEQLAAVKIEIARQNIKITSKMRAL